MWRNPLSSWPEGSKRLLVMVACAVAIWVATLETGRWDSQSKAEAADLAQRVRQVREAAQPLLALRASGQTVQVQRMSRAEAGSWAYWETVARKSGIPTASFNINPSIKEPAAGSAQPALLQTTVSMESITMRQFLAALHYMTAERPYVGISAVQANRVGEGLWSGTVECFILFNEPAPGRS